MPQIIDTPFSAIDKENRPEVIDAFIGFQKYMATINILSSLQLQN